MKKLREEPPGPTIDGVLHALRTAIDRYLEFVSQLPPDQRKKFSEKDIMAPAQNFIAILDSLEKRIAQLPGDQQQSALALLKEVDFDRQKRLIEKTRKIMSELKHPPDDDEGSTAGVRK